MLRSIVQEAAGANVAINPVDLSKILVVFYIRHQFIGYTRGREGVKGWGALQQI